MNRKEAAELLPIIQAFAEGRDIEYRTKGFNENWKKVTQIPELSFKSFEYRIKPEPKFRPFKNAEECWNEMQKHQPFGWLKDKSSNKLIIENVDSRGCVEVYNGGACSFNEVFEYFTFADGLPFGIKEEE